MAEQTRWAIYSATIVPRECTPPTTAAAGARAEPQAVAPGSQAASVAATYGLQNAAQALASQGAIRGVFDTTVQVAGHNVTVGGAVIEGRCCQSADGIPAVKEVMEANQLERAVLSQLLRDPELHPVKPDVNFEKATVTDREFTGVGFFTEFEPSQELKLFADGVALRWGKVGARLNASKIETAYVVYVDNGYVTTIEGYTYGDDWPENIESMELYELKPGMELGSGV